jgi:histone acetyltransferase (RNA polymerase elongator complex component)
MNKAEKPFIIPIFMPQAGCSHQCVFCNQSAITGIRQKHFSCEDFRAQVGDFLKYKGRHRKTVQISFYGGTFLGLPENDIRQWLGEAARFVDEGDADSIRFSTRPDSINRERLDLIRDFPVSTIEVGVQTMDEAVLATARRGHTASDTEHAVCLLHERKYEIGLQMMVGLPDDSPAKALATARKIAAMSPDFVRIYPTLVIENSPLAAWYRNGKYAPLSLEQAVALVKDIYLVFRQSNIPVIRMGLQASQDLDNTGIVLAGPYHPSFGHLVFSKVFLDAALNEISHAGISDFTGAAISLRVHPRSISKMRGMNNQNMKAITERCHPASIQVISDVSLSEEEVKIQYEVEI